MYYLYQPDEDGTISSPISQGDTSEALTSQATYQTYTASKQERTSLVVTVDKNPLANAGDVGSTPGPGRFRMPWDNKVHAPQLQSQHSGAHEPELMSPCAATTEASALRAHSPQQKKPPQ